MRTIGIRLPREDGHVSVTPARAGPRTCLPENSTLASDFERDLFGISTVDDNGMESQPDLSPWLLEMIGTGDRSD